MKCACVQYRSVMFCHHDFLLTIVGAFSCHLLMSQEIVCNVGDNLVKIACEKLEQF